MLPINKKALRTSAITELKQFSDAEKKVTEEQFLKHLTASNIWNEAKTIGITVSQGFEWDTKPIIEAGWKDNKTVAVPKCAPKEKQLTFYKLEGYNQLEIVYYNLLEPEPEETLMVNKQEIDILIVPGLLFDRHGYRIGFGGGFYDRFLTDFSNTTISILHSNQLTEEVPRESFDIPVKYLMTENGWVGQNPSLV
ncbi:5-formyltetrahydrofolate cyclo-ligase [Virgibacillus oceani]